MSRYLLTQSLLGSWLYIYNAEEKYVDSAYNDFIDTLNRKDKPTNAYMWAGIKFEDAVNSTAEGADTTSIGVRKVADIVRGGQKQVALRQNKTIGGINFLLYGRLDYLKAGVIYDIKFSVVDFFDTGYGKGYEVGKYTASIQHPFYFELCPEADVFEYLISDGRDVYKERYLQIETPPIDMTVTDFIAFLRDNNLLGTYFEKWITKK